MVHFRKSDPLPSRVTFCPPRVWCTFFLDRHVSSFFWIDHMLRSIQKKIHHPNSRCTIPKTSEQRPETRGGHFLRKNSSRTRNRGWIVGKGAHGIISSQKYPPSDTWKCSNLRIYSSHYISFFSAMTANLPWGYTGDT
jgi:hypothetical protein